MITEILPNRSLGASKLSSFELNGYMCTIKVVDGKSAFRLVFFTYFVASTVLVCSVIDCF